MLPIERRQRIKQLLQARESIKISELSEQLGVSEMTVHRDVKQLVAEGAVMKTFGGITRVHTVTNGQAVLEHCVTCSRTINERLAYRLILPGNVIENACCAHCGLLRHRQLDEHVIQAICYDFFMQTTTSAPSAWYVLNTSLHIGCCEPQVLTFADRTHAEKFVTGFGGEVYSFAEAMDVINEQMCEHCYNQTNRKEETTK